MAARTHRSCHEGKRQAKLKSTIKVYVSFVLYSEVFKKTHVRDRANLWLLESSFLCELPLGSCGLMVKVRLVIKRL